MDKSIERKIAHNGNQGDFSHVALPVRYRTHSLSFDSTVKRGHF